MQKKKRLVKWGNISKYFIGAGFNLLLIKNKSLAVDVSYSREFFSWLNFSLEWTRKQDHAGAGLELSVLWLHFSCKIQDRRQWDYTANCWLKEPEYEQSYIKYEWF